MKCPVPVEDQQPPEQAAGKHVPAERLLLQFLAGARVDGRKQMHAAARQLRQLGRQRGIIVVQDKVCLSVCIHVGEVFRAQLARKERLCAGLREQRGSCCGTERNAVRRG